MTIHEWDYDRIKSPRLEQIKFHYELPDLYKIKTDDFSNVYPVSILVPEIKITCPDQPELVKQSIKQKILDTRKQIRKKALEKLSDAQNDIDKIN